MKTTRSVTKECVATFIIIDSNAKMKLFKISQCPKDCGSVDRAVACEAKGHWFDSQSGHMPGLQARSTVGGV